MRHIWISYLFFLSCLIINCRDVAVPVYWSPKILTPACSGTLIHWYRWPVNHWLYWHWRSVEHWHTALIDTEPLTTLASVAAEPLAILILTFTGTVGVSDTNQHWATDSVIVFCIWTVLSGQSVSVCQCSTELRCQWSQCFSGHRCQCISVTLNASVSVVSGSVSVSAVCQCSTERQYQCSQCFSERQCRCITVSIPVLALKLHIPNSSRRTRSELLVPNVCERSFANVRN